MSTIYSAGQFDDAFSPKRLGNWESGAKEAYPFVKMSKQLRGRGTKTEIIVNSRGHLLPWVPRDRSKTWGLLNYYLESSIDVNERRKQYNLVEKRCKRIPKFIPKKMSSNIESPPDLLLGYLQELGLPIVWIIGLPTDRTIHKRKKFSQQLAKSLNFSYVNLDDKIQEWKERQAYCTYGVTNSSYPEGQQQYLPSNRDLASTSVAPTKLPTNVPLMCSSDLPCPPKTLNNTLDPALVQIIESERVVFDTAVPIERNKILELYKLAMLESLPCNGFVFDTVPFDLVEGLTFEKVFYPAALAIYFSEGVPQRKNLKPQDRRVTASTAHSDSSNTKILLSPAEYLERCKEDSGNVFLRMKHLKRLGTFNIAEGEKIYKQYGNKTIRVINAEDVGQDTMSFVEELVKRNLEKYEQIKNGEAQIEKIPADFNEPQTQINTKLPKSPPLPTFHSSIDKDESKPEDDHVQPNKELHSRNPSQISLTQKFDMDGDIMDPMTGTNNNGPPPLVPASADSETSIFSLPNIFDSEYHHCRSNPLSVLSSEEEEVQTYYYNTNDDYYDPNHGGAGDSMISRPHSEELWEKIARLESKVVTLNPEETSAHSERRDSSLDFDIPPPPTAYSDEETKLTAAIKNALKANLRVLPLPQHVEYDYGASGDRASDHSFNPLTDKGKESAHSTSEDEDIDYINTWLRGNGGNNHDAA